MAKSDPPKPGPESSKPGPSKEERLARALRENLKRRKAAPPPSLQPSKDRN
jgi:hypothetical protein